MRKYRISPIDIDEYMQLVAQKRSKKPGPKLRVAEFNGPVGQAKQKNKTKPAESAPKNSKKAKRPAKPPRTPEQQRAAKRRAAALRRTLVICAVFAVILIVALNWDTLSPSALLQKMRAAGNERGVSEQYPLDVSLSHIFGFGAMGGEAFLADGSGCRQLGRSEALYYKYSFTDPAAVIGRRNAVIYEKNGTGFAVYNADGKICAGETPDGYPIILAAPSANGSYALLTKPSDFSSKLTVCASRGNELFSQFFPSSAIACIALSERADFCAAAEYSVTGGRITAVITVYDITKPDPVFTEELVGMMPLQLAFDSDGGLCVVCDYGAAFYNRSFERTYLASYEGLGSFCLADGELAVVCSGEGALDSCTLSLVNGDGELYRVSVPDGTCGVSVCGREAGYICAGNAVLLDSSGNVTGTAECTLDTYRIALADGFTVLLGKSKVSVISTDIFAAP